MEKSVKNEKGKELVEPSRFQMELPEECPRCHSIDAKYCYFNNYMSELQPRHFCKACQRFWTTAIVFRCRESAAQPQPQPQPPLFSDVERVKSGDLTEVVSNPSGDHGKMSDSDYGLQFQIPFDPPFLPGTLNIPLPEPFNPASIVTEPGACRKRKNTSFSTPYGLTKHPKVSLAMGDSKEGSCATD